MNGPTAPPGVGSPVRPPAMPQRTAAPAPVPLHPGRPAPAARDDRRTVREAVRSRRRAEAAERRSVRAVRRHRRIAGVTGAVVVLLVGLPLLLAFGPVFPVRTIAVSGASAPVAEAVRSALQGQLGRPVALVGEQDIADALEKVPAVERFTLVRRPPSMLEVAVVPRTPVLQERTAQGWAVLDAARVRIRTTASSTRGLPVLTVPSGAGRPAYVAAVAAVRALAGAGPAVAAVRAASADDVVLTLEGGLTVRWGGAEGGAAKAEALRAALRSAARGASEIDVSSPGVVLTR